MRVSGSGLRVSIEGYEGLGFKVSIEVYEGLGGGLGSSAGGFFLREFGIPGS